MRTSFAMTAAAVLITGCGISPAVANDDMIRRLNNRHQEIVECVSFYYASASCFDRSGRDAELSQQLAQAASHNLKFATALGEKIGLSEDAQAARHRMTVETMISLMNRNCINISSILDRYSSRCKALSQNPLDGFLTSGGR